jgi:hypothetical protein
MLTLLRRERKERMKRGKMIKRKMVVKCKIK